MFKISLTEMQILLLAAKYKNFSKAAEVLYISQPMVTKCVKHLEAELGIQLFERTHRSVELTCAGDFLTKRWKSLLAEIEASVHDAQELSVSGLSLIRIGALEGCGFEELLTQYIQPFEELHPKVHIDFALYPLHELREQIENLDVILSNSLEAEAEQDHACVKLDGMEMCLAVAKEHPLATKESVTMEEIVGEKLLIFSSRTSPVAMNYTSRAFENLEAAPQMIPVENRSTQLMRVGSHQGVALVNPAAAAGYEKRITLVPIRDFPLETYRLAMYRPQKLFAATQKFLEYLEGSFAH
ncbi:MAG: LysR family transcriptional regulator [Acutalibacter sp.]